MQALAKMVQMRQSALPSAPTVALRGSWLFMASILASTALSLSDWAGAAPPAAARTAALLGAHAHSCLHGNPADRGRCAADAEQAASETDVRSTAWPDAGRQLWEATLLRSRRVHQAVTSEQGCALLTMYFFHHICISKLSFNESTHAGPGLHAPEAPADAVAELLEASILSSVCFKSWVFGFTGEWAVLSWAGGWGLVREPGVHRTAQALLPSPAGWSNHHGIPDLFILREGAAGIHLPSTGSPEMAAAVGELLRCQMPASDVHKPCVCWPAPPLGSLYGTEPRGCHAEQRRET